MTGSDSLFPDGRVDITFTRPGEQEIPRSGIRFEDVEAHVEVLHRENENPEGIRIREQRAVITTEWKEVHRG